MMFKIWIKISCNKIQLIKIYNRIVKLICRKKQFYKKIRITMDKKK